MLYKRTNSRNWWMEFEWEGRRIRSSTKLKNKRDATLYESAYRTQLANDKVDLKRKRDPVTIGEAVADFLKWSKLKQKESTFRRYETSSKAIISFFGSKLASEIEKMHVEQYVTWRSKQKKKPPVRKLKKKPNATTKTSIRPATINRELAFLRIVFNRLLDQRKVSENPAARFSFLNEENEQLRVLSPAEEKVYLIACSQPLRDVAVLMLETGMRPSEVFALRVADVNLELGYVQVSGGKTRSARRRIPLTQSAADTLRGRIKSATGEYVFGGGRSGKDGAPIVKLTNAHRAAVDRSRLPKFRLYDLRHTFATRACEAGIDLVTVKDLLGHAKLNMVLRYSHPSEAHHVDAILKLEAYRLKSSVGKNVGSNHTEGVLTSNEGTSEMTAKHN